ncbi:hypothetical protein D3C76_1866110 [compost metagenome]
MGELVEAEFPMVGADPGVADSSEGQMVIGNMADRIVHTASAERYAGKHFLLHMTLFAEQV